MIQLRGHGSKHLKKALECSPRLPECNLLAFTFFKTVFQGAHFDHAAHGDRRNVLCDGNRLVEVLALDQLVVTELLLGFAKGPWVMAGLPFFPLTVVAVEVDSELFAGKVVTAPDEALHELAVLLHDPVALRFRNLFPPLLVEAAHQHVLLRVLSFESHPILQTHGQQRVILCRLNKSDAEQDRSDDQRCRHHRALAVPHGNPHVSQYDPEWVMSA